GESSDFADFVMRKVLIISILSAAAILLISCKMQAQNDNSRWAVVNVSDAFLRAEPRYTSECVSQTRMGTLVQVLERKGYWVRIQTPEPYEGWVNELALAPTRELSPEEQKASKMYGATLEPMTRKEARKYLKAPKYICLQNIPEQHLLMGNMVEKKGYVPGSAMVDFREWAEKEAEEADDAKIKDIINLAKSFLGCPYLWGGMSPGHFDCSGLTGFCYFMNGILLPRDASQQVKCGVEIPFEEMQAGDLVFFGDTSVGHVALCIGDHKIIHASQLVRINSLIPGEEAYYGRNILHIRRILGHLADGGLKAVPIKDSPQYF
ncbi:MAG: C40 family peptidase, partial [Bacteroidales bacterium]|nr:C40 family peptidase [Bacteroidales bacterium]